MNSNVFTIISLMLCLLANIPMSQASSDDIQIELITPHNYGYSLGDEIKLSAFIDTPLFYRLESSYLPKPGAVNSWLQLNDIQLDQDPEQHDYKITLSFQVFRSVETTTQLTIPALPLRFQYRGKSMHSSIPAWSFSYAPLFPANKKVESFPPQALISAPLLADPYSKYIRGLIFVIVLLMLYLLWFYGRLPFLERYSGPFGQACKHLNKLAPEADSRQHYEDVLLCFHQALNSTAGETVFLQNLTAFFARHAAYQGLTEPTEQLLRFSQQFFFTKQPPTHNISIASIKTLCQQYRKIERGNRWL